MNDRGHDVHVRVNVRGRDRGHDRVRNPGNDREHDGHDRGPSFGDGAPAALAAGAIAMGRRYVTTSGDRRGVGLGAFLLAIVTAGALVHVTVRLKGLEVAYALGRERHIATDLEEQRRRLQIEIGMLKDPGRVVLIARDKLKMGPPTADAIRTLAPGQLLPIAAPVPPAVPAPTATRLTPPRGGKR